MRGAMKARREMASSRRDLALMTAYFSAYLASRDWQKMPGWREWRERMTQPKKRRRSAEVIARFRAMAERGFAREIDD